MGLGSVADWVGAVGGLLAVIAATVSWRTSERLVNLEDNRDRKEELAVQRDQAEHVSVIGVKIPNRDHAEKYGIMVFNGSKAPIFEITIESQKINQSAANPPLKLATLPPRQFLIPSHPQYKWGSVIDQKAQQEEVELFAKGKAGDMITGVTFTDASFRQWELVNGRKLRPLQSHDGDGLQPR